MNQQDTNQPHNNSYTRDEKIDQYIMPTDNKPSIYAYYFGVAGFIPFIGLPFTFLSLKYGHQAMKLYKEKPTPGAKAHAKVGIYLAYFEILVFMAFIALLVFAYINRNSGLPKS